MIIRAGAWAVECPQCLRPKNLKSVAMATVVTGYPPKPDQLSDNQCRGLGCETPTSFMPPAAWTVQVHQLM